MNTVECLVQAFRRYVRLPWEPGLAPPQRVWFVVYDPPQERRLRFRLSEFKDAAIDAGHAWFHLDLTDLFPEWMAKHEYRDAYFESPEDMELELKGFESYAGDRVKDFLRTAEADTASVMALSGLGSMFGLLRVSSLIEQVAPTIQGRLVAFFPGHYDGNNYRLLDARDGWNYLAVPITCKDGEEQ